MVTCILNYNYLQSLVEVNNHCKSQKALEAHAIKFCKLTCTALAAKRLMLCDHYFGFHKGNVGTRRIKSKPTLPPLNHFSKVESTETVCSRGIPKQLSKSLVNSKMMWHPGAEGDKNPRNGINSSLTLLRTTCHLCSSNAYFCFQFHHKNAKPESII